MRLKRIHHYEILRRLGSGGSGVVFYAQYTKLLRPVVVKMLRRGWASSEQQRAALLREARLACAIEHPNVCAIYEVGEYQGQAYIVMQYVPGRTLDQWVAAGLLDPPTRGL